MAQQPANDQGSQYSNDTSSNTESLKMYLLDYAKTTLGVRGDWEMRNFTPRTVDEYDKFSRFTYSSSSTTVQPPMKNGWGKWQIIRRTGEYVVKRRSCIGQKCPNKDDGTCTATVSFVSKIGWCGTLILPSGTHASTCLNKRHPKCLSHDGLDGILEYIGHTRADITHASDADILEHSDVVYALKSL